jgi:hypothetical protein
MAQNRSDDASLQEQIDSLREDVDRILRTLGNLCLIVNIVPTRSRPKIAAVTRDDGGLQVQRALYLCLTFCMDIMRKLERVQSATTDFALRADVEVARGQLEHNAELEERGQDYEQLATYLENRLISDIERLEGPYFELLRQVAGGESPGV